MTSSYKNISHSIKPIDTDTETYIAELEKLYEVHQAIVTSYSVNKMAKNVLRVLHKYIPLVKSNIMLFNFIRNNITIFENKILQDPASEVPNIVPLDYMFIRTLQQCSTHLEMYSSNGDKIFSCLKTYLSKRNNYSLFSIPLRLKTTVIGSLNLIVKNSGIFAHHYMSFASSVAHSLTIPLHTFWQYESKNTPISQDKNDWLQSDFSEKIFTSLVKHTPNFILIVDRNGIIKFINHPHPGITVEELEGTSLFDFKMPEIKNMVEQVIITGEPCSCQLPGIDAKGEKTWYEKHLGPIIHEGTIIAVSIISTDITHRKKMEEELHESERKYRNIVDAMPYGVQINDCNGKITFSNKAHCEMLHYADEQLTGKYIWELLNDEKEAETLKHYLTYLVAEQPTPTPYFTQNQTRDGKKINIRVDWTYQFSDEGKVTGFISIITDITHTKLAEASLEESEEKFRTFMESASDLMFIVDKDTSFLYINNAMARTLHYTKDELIGKHATYIMKKKQLFNPRHSELERKGEITFDDIWLTKHGNEIRGELKIVIMYTTDKKYAGARGVFRDITQRENNGKKIRQLSMQIMESQEEERQRIAKDLHDSVIQSMLAAKLHLKMYEKNVPKNKDLFELALKFIDKTNNELREICSNIYPSILNDIGLEAAIRWYAKNYLEINHIKVQIKFNACRDIAHTIKIHLYRIMQELFSNIVKYSGADLVIITLFYKNKKNFFVTVQDNGLGFDLHKVTKEKKGFGFSNIHQRSENMLCKMEIASSPGHGTRILIATKDHNYNDKNTFIPC